MARPTIAVLACLLPLVAAGPAVAAEPVTLFPREAHPTGSSAEAVAIADVTSDGRNDVLVTTSFAFDDPNDRKLNLFAQQANGSLAAPVKYGLRPGGGFASGSGGIATGDVDGDGHTDVATAYGDGITVFFQRNGTLTPGVTANATDAVSGNALPGYPTNARDVEIADVDLDGDADLIATSSDGVVLLRRSGAQWLASRLGDGYGELEIGNLNSDGRPDFATPDLVYLSAPDGSYSEQIRQLQTPESSIAGIEIFDATGDGLDDYVVARDDDTLADGHLQIFAQTATGVDTVPTSLPSRGLVLASGDLNGDGVKDLVGFDGHANVSEFRLGVPGSGLGESNLFASPELTGWYNPDGVAVGDVDGDGRGDVAVANYNTEVGLAVFRQSDSGAETPPGGETPPAVPRDTKAPVVALAKTKVKRNRRASLSFSASERAAFYCQLDRVPYARCTSPMKTGMLKPGKHSIRVLATDAAGNRSGAAVAKFKVPKR